MAVIHPDVKWLFNEKEQGIIKAYLTAVEVYDAVRSRLPKKQLALPNYTVEPTVTRFVDPQKDTVRVSPPDHPKRVANAVNDMCDKHGLPMKVRRTALRYDTVKGAQGYLSFEVKKRQRYGED